MIHPYVPPGCVRDRASDATGASAAVLSPTGKYQFSLTRRWEPGPMAAFVLLHPAIGNPHEITPTVRRCIGLARDWGCGGAVLLHAFAYRSARTAALGETADPVGDRNDDVIRHELARVTGPIVAGWGSGGAHLRRRLAGRDRYLRSQLAVAQGLLVRCLGLTKDHYPLHPLRVGPIRSRLTLLPTDRGEPS